MGSANINGAVVAAAIVSAPRVPLVLGSTGRGALLPGRSSMPASASQHAGLSGRKHTRLVLLAGRRFVLFAGRSTWPGRPGTLLASGPALHGTKDGVPTAGGISRARNGGGGGTGCTPGRGHVLQS